jgi:hypothetical protein
MGFSNIQRMEACNYSRQGGCVDLTEIWTTFGKRRWISDDFRRQTFFNGSIFPIVPIDRPTVASRKSAFPGFPARNAIGFNNESTDETKAAIIGGPEWFLDGSAI